MSSRKLFLSELRWLDQNEQYYRDAFVTHHYVPLVAEFNSRTDMNFTCGTIRNRLKSYRTWKDTRTLRDKKRSRLQKGPKSIDLSSPEKIIKKEKISDIHERVKRINRKLIKEEEDNDASLPSSIDSNEEACIKALFPGTHNNSSISDN